MLETYRPDALGLCDDFRGPRIAAAHRDTLGTLDVGREVGPDRHPSFQTFCPCFHVSSGSRRIRGFTVTRNHP
jgi:hypothetical protein